MNHFDVYTIGNILEHLHLIDLLQVAHGDTHLRQCAKFEFSRRYSAKMIKLSLNEIRTKYSDENSECVTLYGLEKSLQVLRCFGELILHLGIDISGANPFKTDKIWMYFNMYCSESVQFLSLHNVEFNLYTNFEKKFNKLREISFCGCDFYDNLYRINFFFPNLTRIMFKGWNMLIYHNEISHQALYKTLDENNFSELLELW